MNDTITPRPVRADWHRLPTPELVALPRQLERLNCYNRDTILELACALASRVEEMQRLLALRSGKP